MEKYSKRNLQSSNFSPLKETTNSLILASSHSLSIPSEPLDLRNWFSSYRYESPAPNSNSFLDDFGVNDTEREENEENSGWFRRNGHKDEAFVHKKQSSNEVVEFGSSSGNEIRGSSESISFSSEPTDIRNWFSSYAYESPSLDTADGLGDSVCKQSKHEKDGFLVENSNREKEKHLGDFSINRSDGEEVVGETEQSEGHANCNISLGDDELEKEPVSESPSLLSEPIDLRNWFSSYVHESPPVDTTDGFGDSVWKENKSGKDGFPVKNSNRGKVEGLEGFSEKRTDDEEVVDLQTEVLSKCISSSRDNKQETKRVSEGRPSGQNDPSLKHKRNSLQTHVMTRAQDVEMSILNKDSSQCKLEHKYLHGTRIKPSNNERTCSNDEKTPQYTTHSKDFSLRENSEAKFHAEVDCLLVRADSELIAVNGAAERKPSHGGKDRKDDGTEISEDGFITTRKNKLRGKNYESIVEGAQEISKARAPLAGGRDAVAKRKASATDFHHSHVMEITGKWKCPQSSKPNEGPALKQLRLEKWVRKLF